MRNKNFNVLFTSCAKSNILAFVKSRDLFQVEHMHCLANKLGFAIC